MTAIAVVVGRLTRDPELVELKGATGEQYDKCSFSLAVDDSFGNDSSTSFFDVVAWGALGRSVADFKRKGDQVAVTARLRQEKWVADDGTNRQRVVLYASAVEFLATPRRANEPPIETQLAAAPRPKPPMTETLGTDAEPVADEQQQLVTA